MRKIFKFIARFFGGVIVSFAIPPILIAIGVPLDQWINQIVGLIERPPHWLNYEFVYWCLVAFLGILIISLTYLIPSIIDKSKKVNKGGKEGSTVNSSLEAERNVWLLEAIYFVAEGSWDSHNFLAETVDEIEDPTYPNRVAGASKNILQKAADGELLIWGKVNDKSPFIKIEPSYWKNHELEYWGMFKCKRDAGKLETAAIDIAEVHSYTQLKTSRAKIEELWSV